MERAPIPTVGDLTPAWFTEVLRSAGVLTADRAVTEVSLSGLGDAESMMSALRRATLTYDGPTDAPGTVVVKLASSSERQRFVAGMFKFYEREIRFYRELADDTPVRLPRCYLAEIHPTEPDFVLVLEDVGGRRGVDQLVGLDLADAIAAVETIADFHAPRWGADLGGFADPFIPFDAPPMHAIIPEVFANDWAQVRPLLVDELPAEVVALCDRFREVCSPILSCMNGPDTIVHGDYRSDNLLFDEAGPLVLDLQLAAVANGMVDIAYLVGQSVRDDVAAAHAEGLIDRYLARLATHGIELPPDRAMAAYDAAMVFFVQIPMNLLSNPDLPERSKTLGRVMFRRAAAEIMRTGAHQRFA